jgi:hypothetical protein
MQNVGYWPRLLRKMKTWPLNGSAPMICCTLAVNQRGTGTRKQRPNRDPYLMVA